MVTPAKTPANEPLSDHLYDPRNSAAPSVVAMPGCVPVYRGEEVAAYALVDAEVLAAVQRRRWKLDRHGYASTNGGVRLHRYLFGLRPGEPVQVHHRNAEKLDCRRANLEILTRTEHVIAHGMRPRMPIAESEDDIPQSAILSVRWLARMRAAKDACLGDEPVRPMAGSARKLPKVLTADEIALLMARPNVDCPTGLRNRCLLEVMYRGGLRVSEACGVTVRDLDWRSGRLHIREEVAKGGREDSVYLDDRTLELLARWKAVRRRYAAGNPRLFVTLRGGTVDRHYVWEMVGRYARKAGIDRPVHPHMLRHSYGTELLREGFNIREVQTALRHSDVRTTMVYTHIDHAELSAKLRRRRP